jgi:hypothetical protein
LDSGQRGTLRGQRFLLVISQDELAICVFRPNVTDRFGIVTGRPDRQVWCCA